VISYFQSNNAKSSCLVLHGNNDQTLVNPLHGQLDFEIGGLDCPLFTTEYRTHVNWIHKKHLFCNESVLVIYFVVLGQYTYTIAL